MLGKKIEGYALSKGDYLAAEKKNLYPVPSFWNI
jgi:hypothetical protein